MADGTPDAFAWRKRAFETSDAFGKSNESAIER
jgi:hypothetical protein